MNLNPRIGHTIRGFFFRLHQSKTSLRLRLSRHSPTKTYRPGPAPLVFGLQQVELCSLQLLVPLAQTQWEPKTLSARINQRRATFSPSASRPYEQVPACSGLHVFPISAGLAPAGSQLVSYNKRSPLARSSLGLPQWKERLVFYSVKE